MSKLCAIQYAAQECLHGILRGCFHGGAWSNIIINKYDGLYVVCIYRAICYMHPLEYGIIVRPLHWHSAHAFDSY
jgi:hypothetical protein